MIFDPKNCQIKFSSDHIENNEALANSKSSIQIILYDDNQNQVWYNQMIIIEAQEEIQFENQTVVPKNEDEESD